MAAAALAAPPGAQAHVRSGVIAVDYRASVFPLPRPAGAAVRARVYESDRALALTVRTGHAVVVLGYSREPFLRLDTAGTAVNDTSPTAEGLGLLEGPRRPTGAGPEWRLRSSGRTFIWHDARLRGLPSGVGRGEWTVPLLVDGSRVRLAGELRRVRAPSRWLWPALSIPFVVAIALLLLRRRALVRTAAVGFGGAAAAGMIATGAGFAFDTYASGGKWVEAANEWVLALVGLAIIARASSGTRAIAAGALGLLGLAVALSKIPVLLHGVVLSVFPATLARLLVAFTICAGGAATALGLVVFEDLQPKEDGLEQRETRLG